jgi:hypothetical protein
MTHWTDEWEQLRLKKKTISPEIKSLAKLFSKALEAFCKLPPLPKLKRPDNDR